MFTVKKKSEKGSFGSEPISFRIEMLNSGKCEHLTRFSSVTPSYRVIIHGHN